MALMEIKEGHEPYRMSLSSSKSEFYRWGKLNDICIIQSDCTWAARAKVIWYKNVHLQLIWWSFQPQLRNPTTTKEMLFNLSHKVKLYWRWGQSPAGVVSSGFLKSLLLHFNLKKSQWWSIKTDCNHGSRIIYRRVGAFIFGSISTVRPFWVVDRHLRSRSTRTRGYWIIKRTGWIREGHCIPLQWLPESVTGVRTGLALGSIL